MKKSIYPEGEKKQNDHACAICEGLGIDDVVRSLMEEEEKQLEKDTLKARKKWNLKKC